MIDKGEICMQSLFDQLQKAAWIRSLLMLGLGAWIVLAPNSVLSIITWVIAIGLLIAAFNAFGASRDLKRAGYSGIGSMGGVGFLIAAVLVLVLAKPVLSLLPLVLGISLLIYGITRITSANRQQQYVNVSPVPTVIYGILVALAGLVLIFNPFHAVLLMFRIFGGILIVMAVTELFGWFRYNK